MFDRARPRAGAQPKMCIGSIVIASRCKKVASISVRTVSEMLLLLVYLP